MLDQELVRETHHQARRTELQGRGWSQMQNGAEGTWSPRFHPCHFLSRTMLLNTSDQSFLCSKPCFFPPHSEEPATSLPQPVGLHMARPLQVGPYLLPYFLTHFPPDTLASLLPLNCPHHRPLFAVPSARNPPPAHPHVSCPARLVSVLSSNLTFSERPPVTA